MMLILGWRVIRYRQIKRVGPNGSEPALAARRPSLGGFRPTAASPREPPSFGPDPPLLTAAAPQVQIGAMRGQFLSLILLWLGVLVGVPGCDLFTSASAPTAPASAGPSAAQAPVTSATRAQGQRVDIRRHGLRDDDDPNGPDAAADAPEDADAAALRTPRSAPGAPRGPPQRSVDHVEVRGLDDQIVFQGTVDLGPTIDRILAGRAHSHRNDGALFENRERRLPKRGPGHYREYVHPTPDLGGAGPQRIVVGRDGAWYYTPDHYRTFRPLQESVP
jgi:guanyl-specific ribonuclease Sa